MNWLKQLFSRGRLYNDLSHEIQQHLEEKIEELVASGMSRKEAAHAARREFGNVTLIKEDCREMLAFTWIEALWQDVRYAARILAKSPAFAAVVIFSLALGIGANTAVFSVMNTVLLPPLPYEHPETLTTIWCMQKSNPRSDDDVPPIGDIADWKKQSHAFDDIAAVSISGPETLAGAGE